MTICFKKIKDKAIIPSFGHNDDTNFGIDLYSCLEKIMITPPGGSVIVPLGVAWMPIDIPYGHKVGAIVNSRSGLAFNYGVEASNAGVIDEQFRGEWSVKLYNNSKKDFVVENGMRIAQAVITVAPKYAVIEVNEIDDTTRGDRGFGSSGVN